MNYLEDLELAYEIGYENADVIPLLERVVAAADVYQDLEVGVEARDLLIEATVYNGQMKKALQAFAWLVKKYEDKSPLVSTYDILWKYKWITGDITGIASISKAQIEQLLTDMKIKFQENGFSLRPYYKSVAIVAQEMGDHAWAAEYFAKWQNTPADHMNDCSACETDEVAKYYYFTGDSAKTIEVVQPILSGQQSCAEIPHFTYSYTAHAFLDIGKLEEAALCFEKGYPLVRQNPEFLTPLGEYIAYQYRIGDKARAQAIMTENEALLTQSDSDRDKMLFMLYSLPIVSSASHFIADSKDLAAKFDARSGNNYYTALWTAWNEKRESNLEI